MGIKLIAADMDHTLLTEAGELPPDFENLVERLDQAGVAFAAASGRPLYTLEALFPHVRDRMSFIGDNGGVVARRGKILAKHLLSPVDRAADRVAECAALLRFTRAETGGVPILCGLDTAYIDGRDARHAPFLKTFYSRITTVDRLEMEGIAAANEIVKFTVFFPERDSRRYYAEIFVPRYGGAFSMAVSDTMWIDVMGAGVDKGLGMRVLGAALGATRDEMMAFGDSYNDIPLLDAVRHSYAVANAEAEIRRRAAFTAPSNADYGVARIIKKFLEES